MAIYLELLGFIPILSFVTPYKQSRKYLRKNSKQFVEIYLTYDEDRGRNSYFANDFEEPENYNLKINTSVLSIDECIQEIIQYCETQYKDFSFLNPEHNGNLEQ
jgi:adenylylsulfate kinase-like enzyme